jgi:hypothetical protein
LVAIPSEVFENNSHYYAVTAGYLLRTYVYARAFELGSQTFSMIEVARVLGDNRPRERIAALRDSESYVNFWQTVDLLFEFENQPLVLRQESLEAFIVNAYGTCELAVVLGLRILARGDLISYAFLGPKP